MSFTGVLLTAPRLALQPFAGDLGIGMNTVAYSIIVPVWGAKHVDRFLDWVLPTWFSPGNLHDLAARSETELILLAPRADLDRIHGARSRFTPSRHLQVLRPIEIDDPVPGAIGTVTLIAGFRAWCSRGDRSHRRSLRSDLSHCGFLSGGRFNDASIARRFDAGKWLLICASFRAREELIVPDLTAFRRQPNNAIVISPRDAVRLALEARCTLPCSLVAPINRCCIRRIPTSSFGGSI